MNGLGKKVTDALEARASELGRKLKYPGEWWEVIEAVARQEWAKGGAPKKKSVSALSDEEWVKSLEVEPALKGINVRQEIGRAQFWCKNNKRVPTRRFLVNWLNKAEKVVDLKAMGAQHATGLRIPAPAGPQGWREWLKVELDMLSPESPGYGQILTAYNCQNFATLPQSWQTRCRSQLAAGKAQTA